MSEVELTDAILRHALELQRLSAHEEAHAVEVLRQLEDELRQLLATRQLDQAGKRAIESLIKQADEAIAARYSTIAGSLDTRGLVALVADRTVEAMQAVSASVALPSEETLASLARENLIEGTPAADWWKAQADDTARKFAGAVRQGVINNQTQEQIVSRIAGRNGFMEVSKRNARALVHSAVMSAANQARLATYRKNYKFAAGIKWLSTLDSHTCLRCSALDGATWNLEGKPIRGSTLQFQTPPLHWNCRCVLSPIPPSFDEIFGKSGLDDKLAQIGARASSEGPVKSGTTFAEFLARQSPEFISNTLGKRRAELFTQGKITLRDLVSGAGRPLTLDQLKAR